MANSLGTLTLDLAVKLGAFTTQLDRAASATEKSMKQIEAASNQAKLAVNSMFAIVAGGLSVSSLKNAADSFTELNNRLRLVTSSSSDLSKAQADIYRISQITSQSMSSTAQVYQRFAQNAKELGINQQQVANLTETVSKAIAISGSSTEAAEAALVQFGQALNSGVLRGEEFNSVMEQAPGLAKSLADGLGVPIGALRTLANDGKLTTDQLIKALNNASSGVNQQFSTITKTIGQSLTNLSNSFTKYIGEADQAAGVSQTLSKAILFLSENLDTVFNAGLLIAGTRLGAFTASLASSYAVSIKSRIQSIASTKAEQLAQEQLLIARQREAVALQAQAQQIALTARLREMETRGTAQHTVALTALTTARRAETEANIKAVAANKALATAQSTTASLGGTLFRVLGGVSGLGAVLGVAATAWALYSSSGEQANKVNIDLSRSTEDVKKQLQELSKVKLGLAIDDIKNQNKELMSSYDDVIAKIQDIATAQDKSANARNSVNALTRDVVFGDSTGEEFLRNLQQRLNLTDSAISQLRPYAAQLEDINKKSQEYNQYLEYANQLLGISTGNAKELGAALNDAFNPQQIKGLEGLQKQLDDQILRLRDKTGKLTLEAQIKKIAPNGATTPEDQERIANLYKSLNERNSLQASQSGTKSSIKPENDLARAYQNQVEQLNRMLGIEDKKSEVQKVSYELENGQLSKLNTNQKQFLIDKAKEVDLRNQAAEAAKKEREQQEWINALNDQINARQRDSDLDVASVGMGSKQFDEYKELINIQEDYAKKRQALAKELGKPDGLTQEQYQSRISALQDAQNTEVAIVEDAQRRKREAEGDWLNGAIKSYQDYLDEANNVAKQTESLFTNAFGNMENSLVSFVRTGKLSFKSFADALLDDLARIGVRMASSAALKAVFSGIGGLFGTGFTGKGGAPSSATNPLPNALGGVYSTGGVHAFANGGAFTNSIVNKPTLFPFAKGTGLMGEAGPEAIMPLTRTANGSLGVRMITDQLGQSTNSSNPQVNIVINNDGSGGVETSQGYEAMGQEMYRQIQMIADDRIMYQKRQGGMLDPNSRRNQ